jgi:hypothetical protein
LKHRPPSSEDLQDILEWVERLKTEIGETESTLKGIFGRKKHSL